MSQAELRGLKVLPPHGVWVTEANKEHDFRSVPSDISTVFQKLYAGGRYNNVNAVNSLLAKVPTLENTSDTFIEACSKSSPNSPVIKHGASAYLGLEFTFPLPSRSACVE